MFVLSLHHGVHCRERAHAFLRYRSHLAVSLGRKDDLVLKARGAHEVWRSGGRREKKHRHQGAPRNVDSPDDNPQLQAVMSMLVILITIDGRNTCYAIEPSQV